MSSAADIPHEVVVDGPLADVLERLGVHVQEGDRVRLELVGEVAQTDEQTAAWEAFVGSFATGEPDFAERSEEILRAELSQ